LIPGVAVYVSFAKIFCILSYIKFWQKGNSAKNFQFQILFGKNEQEIADCAQAHRFAME
jgi:hypothetical protein